MADAGSGRSSSAGLAERRRADLTDAAFDVFVEDGYERAAVTEIARRAGMGQGTLYRYVGGKRELLELVFDRCVDELIAAVAPDELVDIVAGDDDVVPQQVIDQLGERLFRLVDQKPGLLKIITVQAGAVDEELRYRIQSLVHTFDSMIGRALDEAAKKGVGGLGTKEKDRLLARLLPALVLPGMTTALTGEGDADRRNSYVEATGQLLRHGIAAKARN
ncbi:putative TetR family transcriptional regulator [Gordonia effusa NBRC 100432]|uniref:Putative TetR family transcriptional regulator n=1 Tax=Gordonia effusa NBRC 100432 TaxID=1077974 RepID=H0QWN4_9ACTN|nr:TetR/AcrR family transcriptional regulator [Gordonia effusa]GAB17235.1 putative TetR family transcriptional regulator [Gordonia effusa NBRC 100432]